MSAAEAKALDVQAYVSAGDLAAKAGMKRITAELQRRGLKLGGGVLQRAERLWECKDLTDAEVPAKWLSKARRRIIGSGKDRTEASIEASAAAAAPKAKPKTPKAPPPPRCPSPPVDGAAVKASFPFTCDPLDCAETSPAAYEDVAPVLRGLARLCGKEPAELRIYDPYFCAGAVARRLARLGFPLVRNACVDCYAEWASGRVPPFDVLVTNPPYSADHVARLLEFASTSGRPWLCLMPSYVHLRPEWCRFVEAKGGAGGRGVGSAGGAAAPGAGAADLGVFFVAPRKRYSYFVPKGMGAMGSANGKKRTNTGPRGAKTSPFPSMWYCGAGKLTGQLLALMKDPALHSPPALSDAAAAAADGRAMPEPEEPAAAPRLPPVVTTRLRDVPPAVLDPTDPLRQALKRSSAPAGRAAKRPRQ